MLRLRSAASTGALVTIRGVAHLLTSFVLSSFFYAVLYRTLVPDAELHYPLFFGLCATPSALPTGGGLSGLAGRTATVWLDPRSASAVSPLALGYSYSARVCLELPESPANVAAGTFLAELSLYGAGPDDCGADATGGGWSEGASSSADGGASGGACAGVTSLFRSERPFVLRYRSEQMRYLSNLFFLCAPPPASPEPPPARCYRPAGRVPSRPFGLHSDQPPRAARTDCLSSWA